METLRNVFLKVDAHEMHFLVGRRDVLLCVFRIGEIVQWDAAIRANRHVVHPPPPPPQKPKKKKKKKKKNKKKTKKNKKHNKNKQNKQQHTKPTQPHTTHPPHNNKQ